MQTVALHAAGPRHPFQQERNQRDFVLRRQIAIDALKCGNIIRAVVGRQRHARQQHPRAGILQRHDDLVQVRPRSGDRQAAQPVVAPEFDDDHGWLQRGHRAQTLERVGSGLSADPGVHHAVQQAAAIQFLLQEVRIALAGIGAEAGRKAVAKGHNHGPVIGRGTGLGTLRRFRCGVRSAAASAQ
jgi:hypothetical protein